MEDIITLISVTQTQDEYGVWRMTETSKEVFCYTRSVTRSEFFQAGRNGLNPAFVFTIFGDDYSGEETVEYRGSRYGVYRTYRVGDDLELYAERKGGTNAAPVTTTTSTVITTASGGSGDGN